LKPERLWDSLPVGTKILSAAADRWGEGTARGESAPDSNKPPAGHQRMPQDQFAPPCVLHWRADWGRKLQRSRLLQRWDGQGDSAGSSEWAINRLRIDSLA
jgi:hypothetical protein